MLIETEIECFDIGTVFQDGGEGVSVKIEAAEATDVDTVPFEEATFLTAPPDCALFP